MNFLLLAPTVMGLTAIGATKGDARRGQGILIASLAFALGLAYFFLDVKTVLLMLAIFAVSEILHIVLAGLIGPLLPPDFHLVPVAMMGLFPPLFAGWWIAAIVVGLVSTGAVLFYAHRQKNLVRPATSTSSD